MSSFCSFQGGPLGAQSSGPDADGDGWPDDIDNCPQQPNVGQHNDDIDAFGDVCDPDDDNDGYPDTMENYIGTLPSDNCNATSIANDEPDFWPPDFDDNLTINTTDVLAIKPYFLTSVGDPGYSARHDLNASGSINTTDVLALKSVFLTTCVSTASQVVDVIKATEQYRSFAVAEADGFVQTTGHVPGRGAFFTRPDRLDDGFGFSEPQGLTYDMGPNGWRLTGVFYLVPVWQGMPEPEGFIGSSDVWSVHDDFCIAQGLSASEGVSQSECTNSGGVWWEEMGHFLPAWLFRYNPDGVFAEINPNVD